MYFYGVDIAPQIITLYNVLFQLALLSKKGNQQDCRGVYVDVGNQWLAKKLGISERTLRRWLHKLEINKLISIKRIGQGKNSHIYIDISKG